MQQILFECPNCRAMHALCWMVGKKTRTLGVICDRMISVRRDKHGSSVVESNRFKPVNLPPNHGLDLSGILEHTTPAARKAAQLKGNLQFVLMNAGPGENLERNLNLPRKAESDADKAKKLQVEIAELVEQQAKITKQIDGMARKRLALSEQELELRKKLREVFTEPLNFTGQ